MSLVDGPALVKKNLDSDVQFLVVSDSCSVVWVPYIAGNSMPLRAVVGGRKWNDGPLYVAALWTTNADMNKKYGYHDPQSRLGYVDYGTGAATNTNIDIMVEIWGIASWFARNMNMYTYFISFDEIGAGTWDGVKLKRTE